MIKYLWTLKDLPVVVLLGSLPSEPLVFHVFLLLSFHEQKIYALKLSMVLILQSLQLITGYNKMQSKIKTYLNQPINNFTKIQIAYLAYLKNS